MSQSPPPGPSNQRWRGDAQAGAETAAAASGRGKKLAGLVMLLAALAGAVAALFFYLQETPAPDFVALAVREYRAPVWPTNPMALQDALLLETRFSTTRVERPYNVQEGDGMLRVLKDLGKRGERPLVIYLCALARWSDGQVHLLGIDAAPDRADTWVPLRDVLQRVRECKAPAKLLILDIMRPLADARFGILSEDVAEKTHATLREEKDLSFQVLCACSSAQLSLISEELGHSAFAYYLDQGLAGQADGHGATGKKDHRITVMELAEFVRHRVDRWAWQNRGARQTPLLVGKGPDFSLAQFEDTPTTHEAEYAEAYPPWLKKAWVARDGWRASLTRMGPSVLRHLDAALLRAESRWRGGLDEPRPKVTEKEKDADKEKGEKTKEKEAPSRLEIEADIPRFAEQVQRVAEARGASPKPTLALAEAKPTGAFDDALQLLLPRALDPTVKLDEKDAKKKEALDAEIKKLAELFPKQPLEASQSLFEAAVAIPRLGPPQVYLLHQLLQSVDSKNRHVETVLLERLAAFAMLVKENDWEWPMAAVKQSLRTTRTREALVADLAREPAALPWVADLWKKADAVRRAGEKELFLGEPQQWPQAILKLQQADKLFKEVQPRLESLRDAFAVRDRALMMLAGLGPGLLAEGKVDTRTWNAAVLLTDRLIEALATPEPSATPVVLESVPQLRQHLTDLQRGLDAEVRRCLTLPEDASAENAVHIQTLLECPWIEGPRREELWLAGQKLALRLLKATRALDDADRQATPPPPVTLGADTSKEREANRRSWRARHALAMMQLAGVGNAAKLEKLLQETEAQNDEAAWLALAGRIGEAWPRPALAEFLAKTPDWNKVDRLSRLLPPSDLAEVRSTEPGHWSRNPALAIFRRDLATFWHWLGERFQEDVAVLEPESPFRAFYTNASEECAGFAARLR